MDPARFTRVDPTTWRLKPRGAMRVPVVIYADEALIEDMDDKVLEEFRNDLAVMYSPASIPRPATSLHWA
ncbi:MAG: hypothetical protein WAU59_06330 [Rhodoplanes sp.]